MAQVNYTVDFVEGVWKVGLNGRQFGPYSSLDAAVQAASKAAHKAEAQGYDATLTINTPPELAAELEDDRNVA
jgi:hypothetical protein